MGECIQPVCYFLYVGRYSILIRVIHIRFSEFCLLVIHVFSWNVQELILFFVLPQLLTLTVYTLDWS